MSTRRRRSHLAFSAFLSLLVVFSPGLLHAQVSTHVAYEDYIKKARTFATLDENLFGDKISLQDGSVSFAYEDVSVPTSRGLRVSISRKSAENYLRDNTSSFHGFGQNGNLDIPHMMATYDTRDRKRLEEAWGW